jgi:predicted alpha/beta-fold hydrolase
MEKNGNLRFTYALQANRQAPLVFVIPGTGGNAKSGSAHFIAEKLYALGYQTVVLDDPFSWNFAVAGSQSALPGFLPNDARDMYQALQAITAKLRAEKNVQPKSYSLVGSSLGALATLFVNKIDQKFHFEKIVLINPPLDMVYAVNQLDRLYDVGQTLSPKRQGQIFSDVINEASVLMADVNNMHDRGFMQKAFEQLNLNNADMSYLIGWSFRNSLRDVIFASQQVRDLGILKSPVSRTHRNARYDEARSFSFNDYLKLFVFVDIKKTKSPTYSLEDMNAEASIYQFAGVIKNNPNIFVIHSKDDFLLKAGDLQWLQTQFGPRATLFPYGGHMGSLNFSEFADRLKTIFQL